MTIPNVKEKRLETRCGGETIESWRIRSQGEVVDLEERWSSWLALDVHLDIVDHRVSMNWSHE